MKRRDGLTAASVADALGDLREPVTEVIPLGERDCYAVLVIVVIDKQGAMARLEPLVERVHMIEGGIESADAAEDRWDQVIDRAYA